MQVTANAQRLDLPAVSREPARRAPVSIQSIFRERSPGLARKLPPGALRLIRLLAHERLLNAYIAAAGGLGAAAFCDHVLRTLDITVVTRGEEHLLSARRPLVCANHPSGGAEGIALISVLGRLSGGCLIPANDLLGLITPLATSIVPVRHGRPSEATARAFARAFAGDAPILVFPAGVTARMRGGILREYPWRPSFVTRARHAGRQLVPVAVSGRNSRRFYAIHAVRRALGIRLNLEMMLLVDELLRRRGSTVVLQFLPPRSAAPEAADTVPGGVARDADRATARRIRIDVERVARQLTIKAKRRQPWRLHRHRPPAAWPGS